jgi:enoyl-CoA hydratase
MAESYQHILVERDENIGIVTLNRPQALNALNFELVSELADALTEFDRDSSIRCMVITGAGEKAFAAGADIKEMSDKSPIDMMMGGFEAWQRIKRLHKPVIAAVGGYALGGGCELALMCDLIVAGDSARFGQPEINLGIIPGAGGTQRWPRTVGKYVAMQVNLGGAPIGAQRAYQLGLVNRVVPAEVTVRVAVALGKELAAKPPIALRMAKEAVNQALETPLSEGLAVERKNFYFLFATEDQKEGMKAFLEKRKGQFKGR